MTGDLDSIEMVEYDSISGCYWGKILSRLTYTL